MKLISLNIWGAKAYEPLMAFLRDAARDTDIFCFQEVFRSPSGVPESRGTRTDIFSDLTALFAGFSGCWAPEQDGYDLDGPVDLDVSVGKTMFVRNSHPIDSTDNIFVYGSRNSAKNRETFPTSFQYVRFAGKNKKFVVVNLHGKAFPGTKLDTPERLEQSRKILAFLEREEGAKILCGDFNLLPETESIKMFEDAGLVNLIKLHHIPETRGPLSPFYEKSDYQKFADYAFVSPEVRVEAFRVPQVPISDHLPMILEFS